MLLCAPVEVRLAVLHHEGPATASLSIRWLFLRLRRQFNVEDLTRDWLRQLLDSSLVGAKERGGRPGSPSSAGAPPRQGSPLNSVGEALTHPAKSAVDHSRLRLWQGMLTQFLRASGPPRRYLWRQIRCSRLHLHVEVGAGDAMETALVCGGVWAAIGLLIAGLGGWVRLDETAPDLCVQPNFETICLRLTSECILRLRVANAMIAAIWFAGRLLREKGLVAWLRDRLFRKGVVQGGGTPDSGADENSYGVAQDDGGRQHRRR